MKDREAGDFAGAALLVARLAEALLERSCPRPAILNVNFPPGGAEGWGKPRLTRLGTRYYTDEIVEKEDPRGRKYYWIGGAEAVWDGGDDTDFATVAQGGVSITPLHLNLTDEEARQELKDWDLAGCFS